MTNKNKLLDIAKRTFCLESAKWTGQGRLPQWEEPGIEEAAWIQCPLSAALGTDTRKVLDIGGQTEIGPNVTATN